MGIGLVLESICGPIYVITKHGVVALLAPDWLLVYNMLLSRLRLLIDRFSLYVGRDGELVSCSSWG